MARSSKVAAQQRALFEVAVVTSLEAEDAVSELLSRTTSCAVSTYLDVETKAVTVTAFIPSAAQWTSECKRILAEGLRHISDCGLEIGLGRVLTRRVPRSWAESWKRHFKPIQIGNQLLVKPSWSKKRPKPKQQVVVLDPGLSFGTGQHPTTSFCLRELTSYARASGELGAFLDLGTGSGILAIAAAKLRYMPILAVDFDPESIRVATENAARNGVAKRISFRRVDITKLPRRGRSQYSVVCANVTADILCRAAGAICNRVAPDGVLVLAGILATEFDKVAKHFETVGMKLLRARTEGEWRSGAFAPQPL